MSDGAANLVFAIIGVFAVLFVIEWWLNGKSD